MNILVVALGFLGMGFGSPDDLAKEVAEKGWIVSSAKTEKGDWDLFLMRPDGSHRRNLTNTPEMSEVAARFSPDGKRLLYYRMPKGETLDNNRYGLYELVIANADGTNPVSYGTELPWASWSPDGRQIACLTKGGIQIVDLSTRSVVRRLDRKGIVEQLFWSPDGKSFTGTANGLGEHWAIGRMDAQTGELVRVSDGDCFNCTSDWFPDGKHVVYSKGHPKTEGFAQLWKADLEGKERRMLYGEIGRHIYGGYISPDGKYALFTRSREDLGQVDNSQTTMSLMRLADAPIVAGASDVLRKQYPGAKDGPVLDLGPGWEPHWTYARVGTEK
jgi:Tol biopolymer transport system component